MRWIVGFAVALGIAGHSFAQGAPACVPGQATPPPAEFARWGDAKPLVAATTPTDAQRLPIPLGTAKTLELAFASDVRYAAPPERPDTGAGKAGMIAFDIVTAGIYRVALSGGAWIEVVRHGKTTASVAHRHGSECGTIRKIVDFQLTPGRYILQLSASDTPTVTAMIAKAAAL